MGASELYILLKLERTVNGRKAEKGLVESLTTEV